MESQVNYVKSEGHSKWGECGQKSSFSQKKASKRWGGDALSPVCGQSNAPLCRALHCLTNALLNVGKEKGSRQGKAYKLHYAKK